MSAPPAAPPARTATPAPRPQPPSKLKVTLGWVVGAAVFLVCLYYVDSRWARVGELPGALRTYADLMADGIFRVPVDDPQRDWWLKAGEAMLESLYMAWIGTLLGAALSFPLAFLAAENISPKPVVFVTRQLLNAIRAIPEVILAIAIMLPIFGFGPLAGALALGVHSMGTLGKLTSEVIEGIDPGPVEAANATGARPVQVLRWSVVPQVLPEAVALWLYRFEINIRASAVLGVLGAGGIGTLLWQLFLIRAQAWPQIGVTLAVIILVTIAVDMTSARVRGRIIRGPDAPAGTSRVPTEII